MPSPTAPSAQYSALPYLLRRHARSARSMAIDTTSRPAFRAWQNRLRARLRELTGYDTMVPAPLRPRVTETVACDGYSRQRVEIQTEPGITMPCYVLLPADLKKGERRPAVLCPHGHCSGGKLAPAGVREHSQAVADTIAHYNYDYGVQFARAGLIVLCPDARGFGERQEPSVKALPQTGILTPSCQFLNQMAYPLGQTVTGMWTWDLHRLAQYAGTRNDVAADRIGCAGLSGGGLQTLWATALDDRHIIKAAVVSGYFYGYREALLIMHENCSCNYVPHLYETADMGDIGGLIAPRPLLIETGDADPLNGRSGVRNVKSQVTITRRAYKLLNANQNLKHVVFAGQHRWDGAAAVPWMKDQLSAPDAAGDQRQRGRH